ncbi:MAG TPA: GNAT family N-acetyltransferase [Nitrososphaerales archaeon]|nr:GNAT family N-acetyltransferase [Nitrososphaerales archaeon]
MTVIVREAKPSDKKPLMHFVTKTWGGHDYIPSVWDEWLRDKGGKMFVVEVDGKQVGMNRVRLLKDGTGWLEGVRIHPDFRGKGLASLLGEKSMEYASKLGVSTFRLTSSSRNRAAHRQVAKMGFSEVARFDVLRAGSKSRLLRRGGVGRLTPADLNKALRVIRGSEEYRAGMGVYWDAFVTRALDREALSELIAKRYVFSAGDEKGNTALAVCGRAREGEEVWLQMSFLCGEPELCKKIVSHLFRSPRPKRDENFVFLPKGSRLSKSLKEIGLKNYFQMVIFEGRLN